MSLAEQKQFLRAKLRQLGSAEEVEIDMSAIKKNKRRKSSFRGVTTAIAGLQTSEKKKKKRRGSMLSNGSRRSNKSKGSSGGNSNRSKNFQERLSQYRASNQGDSDDDDRRQINAPTIAVVGDGTVTKEKPKRRKSRRGSIGLRRDSRSGARAVSPAAFLQYQNNFNMADMSQFMGGADAGGNSPKRDGGQKTIANMPFLETGQNKSNSSIYKKNEEEYKKEIADSLKMGSSQNIRNAGREENMAQPRLSPHRKSSSGARLSPINR